MGYWQTTALLAIILTTSGACIGVLGLWAATSPRHWLLRTAAVLAAVFFITTLALAYFGNSRPASSGSVLETPAAVIPASGSAADAVPAAPVAPASGAAQIPSK